MKHGNSGRVDAAVILHKAAAGVCDLEFMVFRNLRILRL
ncbi:hypothetical protein MDG893_13409 [Marinobacter algicola DG893]|uniref:Uncharacterized protein n=1 Tax=Marinobacter algicola DG893 TaxID=443152 RepID=A6F4N4_9GAMM|nr:hypothetical protein MDG893_13409 [Marinobacter algicola DG893]